MPRGGRRKKGRGGTTVSSQGPVYYTSNEIDCLKCLCNGLLTLSIAFPINRFHHGEVDRLCCFFGCAFDACIFHHQVYHDLNRTKDGFIGTKEDGTKETVTVCCLCYDCVRNQITLMQIEEIVIRAQERLKELKENQTIPEDQIEIDLR